MGKVIDFGSHLPYMEGKALCLQCKSTWHAIAPIGCVFLECAVCGCGKGVFQNIVADEVIFSCDCGCVHFTIRQGGYPQCGLCGKTHKPLDEIL